MFFSCHFSSSFFRAIWRQGLFNELLELTDEEDADYRSFESLIATNDNFQSSKVMLCIFHAIWQPFKWDIYPLCPRKSNKGKPMELTKIGSAWGELRYCLIWDGFCHHFCPNINILVLYSNLYIHHIPIPSLCLSDTRPVWKVKCSINWDVTVRICT